MSQQSDEVDKLVKYAASKTSVEKLQRQLEFSWQELDKYKKENDTLKRTLRAALQLCPIKVPEELDLNVPPAETQPWTERSEHFDEIREAVLDCALSLIRKEGKAVDYDAITREFRARYQALYYNLKTPGETLSRRCREIRDAGYLSSPEPGLFFLGERLVQERQRARQDR